MITAAQYTESMERHGTPDWTAEDARVQQEWSEQVKEADRKRAYEEAVARKADGQATDEDNRLIDQYADKYGNDQAEVAGPVAVEPDVEEVPDYDEWSKDDLVEECRVRGLSTSGNKPELAARLRASDEQE